MIKILESDRIQGYDDLIANRKTDTRDTYEDPYEAFFQKSKDILKKARINGNIVLDGSNQSYECENCKYTSEHIMTSHDDDFDRIVCYAKKCPYGVWTRKNDEYGRYIQLRDGDTIWED